MTCNDSNRVWLGELEHPSLNKNRQGPEGPPKSVPSCAGNGCQLAGFCYTEESENTLPDVSKLSSRHKLPRIFEPGVFFD